MLYSLKCLENIGWRFVFLIHVLILTSCERFVVNKKVIYIWKTFPCVPWGIPGPFPQYITCAVHHIKKKAAGSILITSTWTLKAKQVCLCFSASECKIQQCSPLFDHQKSAHACNEINMWLKWHLKCWEMVWNWHLNNQMSFPEVFTSDCSYTLSYLLGIVLKSFSA